MAWLHDYRVFWRQFRENFHTTGAIAPSGRALSKALASFVAEPSATPRRVLEVGPGTGAVTAAIVRALGVQDRFDLVELNESFVARLNERFAHEPAFQTVADRSRVLHQRLETLPCDEPYDLIISGLPLNNFSIEAVEQILGVYTRLLKPGGTLSFFEYIAIRQMRAIVGSKSDRLRLSGIGVALDRILVPYEIRRDWIWLNLLPAWAHHVRI